MIISFHPCIEADVHIILGDRFLNKGEIQLIKKADAIILPQACSEELFNICSDSKAYIFPEYRFRFKYSGKIGQIKLFKELHLPYPNSMCWNDLKDLEKNFHKLPHKLPFILKEDMKHEGSGVYVIESIKDLKEIAKRLKGSFITQELINCEGNVLRVVVIGERLFSYWKRPSFPNQIITTINKNARIDHDWMPYLQEKGKSLVKQLISKTGINLAAVDIVFKDCNQPLLLEINYYFGRKGLGGSENYYYLLFSAIQEWLKNRGLSPDLIKLVF